jgi:3-deoxy-D-manno-octulosonic-acid transferase
LLARFCGKQGHADALRAALANARISAQARARWLKELR